MNIFLKTHTHKYYINGFCQNEFKQHKHKLKINNKNKKKQKLCKRVALFANISSILNATKSFNKPNGNKQTNKYLKSFKHTHK